MSEAFHVGQKLVATRDIWQEATEDVPCRLLANGGDLLIVRSVSEPGYRFPIYVSHEHRTDASFGVDVDEVRAKGGA